MSTCASATTEPSDRERLAPKALSYRFALTSLRTNSLYLLKRARAIAFSLHLETVHHDI